jgi:hypothetical protein
MGYACPVCGTPQADARHLANHLAFTAMLHGEDHEAWLDEHAPDWQDAGEQELADRVRGLAADADYPQVFEDTTGRMEGGHDHEGDHDHGDPPAERSGALFDEAPDPDAPAVDPETGRARGSGRIDEETREVLAEARDLTREMLAEADEETDGNETAGAEETDDADGESAGEGSEEPGDAPDGS